jgi:hypothetical protein
MRREDEYRQLANSVRERAGDEESALLRAQWEILAGTYVRLADQSAKTRQPKKMTPAHITIRWIGREPCGPRVPPKLGP